MMIPSADMRLMTLAVTVLVFARSSAQVVECSMPSVREHESATITCNFKEDVSKSDNSLRVLYLKDLSNDDILDCYKQFESGVASPNFTCITHVDFTFDNKLGTTVSVTLPDARPQHEGRYACQKLPSASDKFIPCNFTLKADSDESGGNGGAIAGGVIGALAFIALVGVVIWKREALMAIICPNKDANANAKDESGNNIIYKPPKKQPADAEETKQPMVQGENV